MEDIINRIDGQVQVIFERGEGYQTYRDAIWMSEAEYNSTPSETLDEMKKQRYDNWIAMITALPTVETAIIEDTTTNESAPTEDSTPTEESAPTEDSAPSDSGATAPTEPV
jgi:hypothetical protein